MTNERTAAQPAAQTLRQLCETNEKAVSDYVAEYEWEGDNNPHWPTNFESALIADAIAGLICDEQFVATFNAWQDKVRSAQINAATNSAAGVAESQAPAPSEPGDGGVAPTRSAPSAAPAPTQWTERLTTIDEMGCPSVPADFARSLEALCRQQYEALRIVKKNTAHIALCDCVICKTLAAYAEAREALREYDQSPPPQVSGQPEHAKDSATPAEAGDLGADLDALVRRLRSMARLWKSIDPPSVIMNEAADAIERLLRERDEAIMLMPRLEAAERDAALYRRHRRG